MIDLAQLAGFTGVPLVIALIQIAKATFPSAPSQAWPVASLAIAVAWNEAVAAVLHQDLAAAALVGIVVGLTASGLYSHATTLFGPVPHG